MHYEYQSPRCVDLFAPIDREQVLAIANAEKWSLPDDYVEFLCAHNGMIHQSSAFLLAYQHSMDSPTDPKYGFKLPFKIWPQPKVHFDSCGFVGTLFGLADVSDTNDLRNAQGHYGFKTFAPPGFFAIGCSGYQNYVALCLDGEWKGKVFEWHHPIDYEEYEVHSYAALTFVADSFRAFWEGLVEVPDEALDC